MVCVGLTAGFGNFGRCRSSNHRGNVIRRERGGFQ